MYKWLITIICLLSLPVYAISPEAEEAAKQAIQEGQRLKPIAFQNVQNFDPNSAFSNYSNNPKEAQYYQAGKQDLTKIDHDAIRQTTESDNGKNVLNAINQHPQYTIRPTDTDINRSILLQSDADNIIHGMTGKYVDCHAKRTCEMRYIEKMCIASSLHNTMSCQRNLIINTAQPQQAYQTIKVHIQMVSPGRVRNATVNFNIGTGKINASSGGKIKIFTIEPALPTSNCPHLTLNYIGMDNNSGYKVNERLLEAPSCQNGLITKINLRRPEGKSKPFDVVLKFQFPYWQEPAIEESWSNGCNYLDLLKQQGICQPTGTDVCTSKDSTRVINGISVTRPCWSKKTTYTCNNGEYADTCQNAQLAGCEQITSTCEKTVGGICMASKQSYRCPQQACVNTADVMCGDGSDYCLEGNCVNHTYQPSKDFGKAVVSLTATNEAIKSFDANAIFKGRSLECRDDAGNFSNCCNESGWGQDIHLAHCSDEEKALGDTREKKLAIKVGRYCSSQIAGICTEHKEAFCVFNSKIARIIQEQGRRGQLRIRFGDAKHPNCRGITPQELQRIDFSRVNFGQELYDDMAKKMKQVNVGEMQQLIQQHVERFQESGTANG